MLCWNTTLFTSSLKRVLECLKKRVIFCVPGGSLRGRGWKYGSGFVDGIFPVLSPTAQMIVDYVQKGVDSDSIWRSLDVFPASLDTWDDIVNVAVQLRMRKHWDAIISVRGKKKKTHAAAGHL